MPGAPSPQKTLPRVRTYARDLEAERARRDQPTAVPATPAQTVTAPDPKPVVKPAPVVIRSSPKPPPPNNPITTKPLVAENKPDLSEDLVLPKAPSLSESIAAVVSENSKQKEQPAPVTPNAIPAFHELTKPRPQATSPQGATPATSGYSATIITDTRSSRFLFLPKIFSAISGWWAARAKKRAAAQVPKYVIPETDRRKGVIQQATSQTAKVTTGDYEGLRQRLKERVEVEATAPLVPAAPVEIADEAEVFWTPHLEPIFPLLSAPQYTQSSVQNVNLTPKRRSESVDVDLEAIQQPTAADTRWEAPVKTFIPPPVTRTPEIVPAPRAEVPSSVPVAAPVITAPEPDPVAPVLPPIINTPVTRAEEVDEDAPLPAPKRPRPSTNPKQRPAPVATPRKFFFHTNTLTISIVGVVLLGSLAVYITPHIISLTTRPAPVPEAATSATLAAPVIKRDLPELRRDAIITALNINEEERTIPAVEIVFRNSAGPSATDILATMDPSLPPSIVQNISNFSFGWYEKTEPFIVLTISDRTSVWGGMLQHENSLAKALSPLFTSTDEKTNFADRTVGGHDVRTAFGPDREETLTYGLIDDETLIITTTNKTFLSVETLVTTVR